VRYAFTLLVEKPVSEALHKVITNVWSTGRVPAEWKEGIIVSLYKGQMIAV